MELDNYRNFLAIIEAGSFTGAADYVHIAQPALGIEVAAKPAFDDRHRLVKQAAQRTHIQ